MAKESPLFYQTDSRKTIQLDDGLVLRWSTTADTDNVALLLGQAFRVWKSVTWLTTMMLCLVLTRLTSSPSLVLFSGCLWATLCPMTASLTTTSLCAQPPYV